MTNSEKLLSSFSEDFFYKELVYADLKFVPKGGTEIELADLIINLEDSKEIQIINGYTNEPKVELIKEITPNNSEYYRITL